MVFLRFYTNFSLKTFLWCLNFVLVFNNRNLLSLLKYKMTQWKNSIPIIINTKLILEQRRIYRMWSWCEPAIWKHWDPQLSQISQTLALWYKDGKIKFYPSMHTSIHPSIPWKEAHSRMEWDRVGVHEWNEMKWNVFHSLLIIVYDVNLGAQNVVPCPS